MKIFERSLLLFFILTILCCHIVIACGDDSVVCRAEMADIALDTREYAIQKFGLPIAEQPIFSDISESKYAYRIESAHIEGLVSGVGGGKYEPERTVGSYEAISVFYRVIKRIEKLNNDWNDVELIQQEEIENNITSDVPEWCKEAYAYLKSKGYLEFCGQDYDFSSPFSRKQIFELSNQIKNNYSTGDDGEKIDFETFIERLQKRISE